MLTFFSIVFTLIFIGLLLHLAYSIDEKKSEKRSQELEQASSKTIDPRKVFGKEWQEGVPRPRICPCCGTPLERHEYLYASMMQLDDNNQRKSVHIYGCRYCYLGMDKTNESTSQQETPTESLDF